MTVEITEFVDIDPDSVHAVYKAANGTPFLMIKQVGDGDADDKPEEDEEPDAEGKATKELEFCGDATCEVCLTRASKGKLSTAERRQIPSSSFAIPAKAPEAGSYPINDRAHARNALSRVSQHGTPEEKAKVRRAVATKFPDVGKGKKQKRQLKKAMAGQAEVEQRFHGENPSPSSLMGQTKGGHRDLPTNKDVTSDRPSGKPKHLDGGSPPQEATGFGRTAPEKDLHMSEAGTQGTARESEEDARQAASKAGVENEVDMKGDAKLQGSDVAERPQSQTERNQRKGGTGPGDGIRDQMTRQNEQAQKGFKFKVKKNGKKKNKKKAPFAITGALKQDGPERVLSVAHATKELDDMTGSEFAETLVSVLDARDARKAEERKAKKSKKAKQAKKREKKNAGATKSKGIEEAAQEAAKSISPETLVEGIGARVEAALKEAVAPLWGKMQNLENQPARTRPALNNLAGNPASVRDQQSAGGSVMDILKPLADAFKSEQNPQKKEKLGGELTLAQLTIAERIRHGQPVSPNDAKALAATQ